MTSLKILQTDPTHLFVSVLPFLCPVLEQKRMWAVQVGTDLAFYLKAITRQQFLHMAQIYGFT